MKKFWIVLLAATLLLSGCGNHGTAPTTPPSQPDNGVEQPTAPQQPEQGSATDPTPPENTQGSDNVVTTQPDSQDSTLTALQAEIADSGALFGVAYLGFADLPYWMDVAVYVEANGFSDEFPFLLSVMEDHAVLQEGGEVYAVVPANKDVSLIVSEFLMDESNDFVPHKGADLLTVTDGKPILLRGNVSEIVPNLLITAQKPGGQPVEYNPCLSGMDGSLVTDGSAYDFTPYHLLPYYDVQPDPVFTLHTWYAQHEDGDGNLVAMTLVLNPDGTATYSWGHPDSDVLERFEGTWAEEPASDGAEESILTLEMTGGPVDALGAAVPDKQAAITCRVAWEVPAGLVLHHVGDTPLLDGTDNDSYTFLSFDGFHMVNTWTTLEEYWGWYYDLQLLANETCALSIGEIGGSELARYEGQWYMDESALSIFLWLFHGEHPESPDVQFIYGDYLVENWTSDSMTLSFLSGAILTPEMEETGSASFSVSAAD